MIRMLSWKYWTVERSFVDVFPFRVMATSSDITIQEEEVLLRGDQPQVENQNEESRNGNKKRKRRRQRRREARWAQEDQEGWERRRQERNRQEEEERVAAEEKQKKEEPRRKWLEKRANLVLYIITLDFGGETTSAPLWILSPTP